MRRPRPNRAVFAYIDKSNRTNQSHPLGCAAGMAVLKVLGFQPGLIMALVVGEATLVGAVSGLAGAAVAWTGGIFGAVFGMAGTFVASPTSGPSHGPSTPSDSSSPPPCSH